MGDQLRTVHVSTCILSLLFFLLLFSLSYLISTCVQENIFSNIYFILTINKSLMYVSWKKTAAQLSRGNLVPRVFSLSNMAAVGEKTLAHSRNHVSDLSAESGNLFKRKAKIKSERIWVRGLETGEKQTKWRQRQTQKKLKI